MADHAYLHTLRIMGPPPEAIRDEDEHLWEEIGRDRAEHDDDTAAIYRWLGGLLEDITDELNGYLPNGWYAKIDEVAREEKP